MGLGDVVVVIAAAVAAIVVAVGKGNGNTIIVFFLSGKLITFFNFTLPNNNIVVEFTFFCWEDN